MTVEGGLLATRGLPTWQPRIAPEYSQLSRLRRLVIDDGRSDWLSCTLNRVGGQVAKRGAVLVLEDEAEIADWLAEFVADAGYSVIGPVASSLKAQELINERGIDAALLDVTLKHGDQSLELAERLQAMRIPFAFVTAYSRALLPVGFQEVPCIVKPFSQEEVVSILSKLLPPSAATTVAPVPVRAVRKAVKKADE